MSQPSSTPEERFAALVDEFLSNPEVTPPSDGNRFGSSGRLACSSGPFTGRGTGWMHNEQSFQPFLAPIATLWYSFSSLEHTGSRQAGQARWEA